MKHEPNATLVSLNPTDLALVTLYGEASGEPIDGQIAVTNIFKNRLADGRWGDTLKEVLLGWAQFSCLWPELGGKNFARVLAFAENFSPLLPTPKPLSSFSPAERQMMWVIKGVFEDHILDNTKGATHYYAVGTPTPKWAREGKFVGQRGKHLFFAGVK